MKLSLEEFVRDVDYMKKDVFSALGSIQTFHRNFYSIIPVNKELASRHQFQWGRKFFHVMNSVFGLWLYVFSGMSEPLVLGVLSAYFGFSIVLEIARRKLPRLNEKICRYFSGMMRERERTQLSSATLFLGSVLAIMFIFPKDVVILSILFVAFGDTAAGVVGVHFGRHKLGTYSSLEGFLAGFITCFFFTMLFTAYWLPHFKLSGLPLLGFSFLAGLIGAISEILFKKLDDNLVIPIISAPLIFLLMKFFTVG